MKKILTILGPTASGKTDLSVKVSELIDAEIISADSRQIYKNIGIATCVPSLMYRKKIKHHFIEEIPLEKEYNAGLYSKDARDRIKKIFGNNKEVLIAGGSGLYIRALIDGLFEINNSNSEIRDNLYEDLKEFGREYLYNRLMKVDPDSASKMDPTKYRRVIRALEVFQSTGYKISDLQKVINPSEYEYIQLGLLWDRDVLYKRINLRVEKMIRDGLIGEVERLIDLNYHYSTHNSLNTVGIKEVMKYFEKKYTFDEMKNLIKQNSRRYAKRQMTWFRKDERIKWLNIKEYKSLDEAANYITSNFFN